VLPVAGRADGGSGPAEATPWGKPYALILESEERTFP
jgi:hypothetical protein